MTYTLALLKGDTWRVVGRKVPETEAKAWLEKIRKLGRTGSTVRDG